MVKRKSKEPSNLHSYLLNKQKSQTKVLISTKMKVFENFTLMFSGKKSNWNICFFNTVGWTHVDVESIIVESGVKKGKIGILKYL